MNSFDSLITNFHFVRPYWLLAILVLLLVLWRLKKHRFYQSPWQQFLPHHLSHVLVEGASSSQSTTNGLSTHLFLLKPFIIGLLTIFALLCRPVWKKLPQPVYQTERGSVLIMDMSYSMYATDIKPNRLTRARFKAIDLLNKINEGDTGLIAYLGDAFVISPLTQDVKNIALLLPSLTPEIMPVPGANPLAALTLAHEMLLNAGHLNGDIYWFTDDVDNQEINDIYQWSNKFGHQLNILGVGSQNGAPITLPSGELLKDGSGAIVVPRLPSQKLMSLASRGNGNYQTIKNDDSDINQLIVNDEIHEKNSNDKQQSRQTGDQWQEQGAWLLVLVLPLLLSYFRRGSTVLMIPLACLPLLSLLSFSLISPISFAVENDNQTALSNTTKLSQTEETSTTRTAAQGLWESLWQTNDQQAQKNYDQENYQSAAQQFENPQWQGSAHYKAGNYEEALKAFKQGEDANTANALYNQGNALAQLKKYEQAIESYEKALKKDPELQDAKDNIETIKQQQKEEQKQQNDQSQDQQNKDNQQDEQSQDQQNKENQQGEQSQDQQNKDEQQNAQNDQSQEQQNKQNQQKDNEADQEKNSEETAAQQDEQQSKETEKEQQENNTAEQSESEDKQGKEKTAAQIAAEQQAKETEQKHQQLLNKVTDDPYLLLRNKMQLEYQKRKQNGASQGVKKQW
ncbi:tetratricopeptide repeat protein [Colwellia sp. MSW7]|uniref:Tetratricopeptide repeat protein n=1 Tax=Colwellia maritima TaxID=2912588 RepID=A0ABS9X5N2_9GAMM|nr:tetratricopeptide repeat protein [Colwellia maritima]MCI2285545.1 tetratricopeptide repeat protein [Colwellia maritima]